MAVSVNTLVGNIAVGLATGTYTPALNVGATNATATGKYHQKGDRLFCEGTVLFSGAGGAGAAFTVSLPSGYVIDTSKIAGGTATDNDTASYLGDGQWFDAGTAFKQLHVVYNSTTTVKFDELPGLLLDSAMASGDGVKFRFDVPVTGALTLTAATIGVTDFPTNATELQGLTVAGDAPSDGDVLSWDDGAQEWTPVAPSGGGANELIVVNETGSQVWPASAGAWGDLDSIELTAGTWDISVTLLSATFGSTDCTRIEMGIGAVAGNNQTGLDLGLNYIAEDTFALNGFSTIVMAPFEVTPVGTTTYYLKVRATTGNTNLTAVYSIRARRIA